MVKRAVLAIALFITKSQTSESELRVFVGNGYHAYISLERLHFSHLHGLAHKVEADIA